MKELLDIAENYGTGLSLFNALRRAYPRDPGLDSGTYNQLIGWLTTFIGRAIKGGSYVNSLADIAVIDNTAIPKNYYLRKPDNIICPVFIAATYWTMDTETGSLFQNQGYFFIDQQVNRAGVFAAIEARINQELAYVAASNNRDKMYQIVPQSIQITAAVRTC